MKAKITLSHLPPRRRPDVRAKVALFERITRRVGATGNKRLVMEECRKASARRKSRPGWSALRLYNQFYAWRRANGSAAALAKATAKRTEEEVATYLPHMVLSSISNDGLALAVSYRELKAHGAPISATYRTYARAAELRGWLPLIRKAKALARTRAQIVRDHERQLAALQRDEERLLARVSPPRRHFANERSR